MKKRLISLTVTILFACIFSTVTSAATKLQPSEVSQVAYTEGVYLSPVDTSKTEGITLSRKSESNSSFKHQANDTDS